jgi:hypothetical protein
MCTQKHRYSTSYGNKLQSLHCNSSRRAEGDGERDFTWRNGVLLVGLVLMVCIAHLWSFASTQIRAPLASVVSLSASRPAPEVSQTATVFCRQFQFAEKCSFVQQQNTEFLFEI